MVRAMSLTFPLVDSQTGYEIIAFIRRGRWYWYLRHPKTKRFIRRIRELTVKITVTVDYPKEVAKKQNPLYVDLTIATTLVDHFEPKDILEVQDKLIDKAHKILEEKFSEGVPRISEVSGIEYFARRVTRADFPECKVELIWWHHHEGDGNEEEFFTEA